MLKPCLNKTSASSKTYIEITQKKETLKLDILGLNLKVQRHEQHVCKLFFLQSVKLR